MSGILFGPWLPVATDFQNPVSSSILFSGDFVNVYPLKPVSIAFSSSLGFNTPSDETCFSANLYSPKLIQYLPLLFIYIGVVIEYVTSSAFSPFTAVPCT